MIQQDGIRFNFGEMAGLGGVTCLKTLLPRLDGSSDETHKITGRHPKTERIDIKVRHTAAKAIRSVTVESRQQDKTYRHG